MFVVKMINKDSKVTQVFTTEEYSIFPSEADKTEQDVRFEMVGGREVAMVSRLDHKRKSFYVMNSDGKTIDRF